MTIHKVKWGILGVANIAVKKVIAGASADRFAREIHGISIETAAAITP